MLPSVPNVGIRVQTKGTGELGTVTKVLAPRVYDVELDRTGKKEFKMRDLQSITLKINKKGYVTFRKFKALLDR